ncbi:hypothetical protein ES705_20647 [subsurface metagenome]
MKKREENFLVCSIIIYKESDAWLKTDYDSNSRGGTMIGDRSLVFLIKGLSHLEKCCHIWSACLLAYQDYIAHFLLSKSILRE